MLIQPDLATVEGLRDRAILETFYATAMRRMEVANLKLYDIDQERGAVMIRQGKGKKDRYIPIGERALAWIGKYVGEARPSLLCGAEDGTVFLTNAGSAFARLQLTSLVRRYVGQAGDRQDGRLPPVPPHGGDADAGERGRHPGDSGNAGARQDLDDGAVYAGFDQPAAAGVPGNASGREHERSQTPTTIVRDAEAEAELLATFDRRSGGGRRR